jgi:hypothetical protein
MNMIDTVIRHFPSLQCGQGDPRYGVMWSDPDHRCLPQEALITAQSITWASRISTGIRSLKTT